MEEFKKCSRCKVPKQLNEFHKRKSSKDGHDHYCKSCGNSLHKIRYTNNPGEKDNKKYAKYNITRDDFINMYNTQNNKCKICGEKFDKKRLVYIDHNHNTNKVRGLLCPKCNNLLGNSCDNIEILKAAIIYLEEYK
jgi:hypothetical protein